MPSPSPEDAPDPRLNSYSAGQWVMCRIRESVRGGYTAYLDDNVDALLHTKSEFHPGEEVSAVVVAISSRVLLTDRRDPCMSNSRGLPKFMDRYGPRKTQIDADRDGTGRPPGENGVR